MLRKLYLCLLALLLTPLALTAQEKNGAEVLILSSHTESSEWARQMLQPIEEMDKARADIHFSTHYFQLLAHPSVEALEQARDSVLDAQPARPDLVILLGGSCFNFAIDVGKKWPGIPMILLGEQDFYCDIEYTLLGPGDPFAKRYPINDLREKGYNLTLITAPLMIRRTLDLMFTLQPDLEQIIFVVGENYMCKEREWRVKQYLEEGYPDVPYRIISSANTSTDQLIATLRASAGPRTAVLFGSWLSREDYLEKVATRHNTLHMIESIAPTYPIYRVDMEDYTNLIGFYSYTTRQYTRTVYQRILDVVDSGIAPTDLPFVFLEAGFPTVNYHGMTHFGLDTSRIPAGDTLVHNGPENLWEAHKKTILLSGFLLLLALALFAFFVMNHSLRSLKKAKELSDKANKMKEAFIHNMSHEFRTPLNSLVGFSQLLCVPDGYITDDEKAEYLGYIMNNCQLLTVMVNDMLSLADMEKGEYAVSMASTNLNEVARLAIKSTEIRIPPGIEIIRQPGIDEDARYMADGLRVQQILVKFLTNACKYTSSGKIIIGSSLVENPGYITFFVADTGIGVPEEKAESIFEAFVKLDEHKQGAGLGLSVCRMMAANMDGKVWLDTSYTDGARFVLAIPLIEAPAQRML